MAETTDERRAKLERALKVAIKAGNPFLEASIRKAILEIEKTA